jgi:hypothetical protein
VWQAIHKLLYLICIIITWQIILASLFFFKSIPIETFNYKRKGFCFSSNSFKRFLVLEKLHTLILNHNNNNDYKKGIFPNLTFSALWMSKCQQSYHVPHNKRTWGVRVHTCYIHVNTYVSVCLWLNADNLLHCVKLPPPTFFSFIL